MKKVIYDVTLNGITVVVKARDRFGALAKAQVKVNTIINKKC